MTRVQLLYLLLAGVAAVTLGAGAVLVSRGADGGAGVPVPATDESETVVVTETVASGEVEVVTETVTKTSTETEPAETVIVTETQTETQTQTVEDVDIQVEIDDVSVVIDETYDECGSAVDVLIAEASSYDGSVQSYADLARAAAAAEAACAEAASDLAELAEAAEQTGSQLLAKALSQHGTLAEAQTGAAGSLDQALGNASRRSAGALAASYARIASSFQAQAQAASKLLGQARVQAGLPAQPESR